MVSTFDVTKHNLVPKHSVLTEKERDELFEKYNITIVSLPKIVKSDSAIQQLNPKLGDVIKIVRMSPTSGTSTYYRGVVSG